MGGVKLSTEHVTSAAPERVWEVLADLEAWPVWLSTVDTLVPLTPGATAGIGATYVVTQPKLPKATWTITEWSPDAGFTWVSKAPGITSTATHTLTGLPRGGTRIELSVDWAGPLAWLLRAAYGRLSQRYIDTEARLLAVGGPEVGDAGLESRCGGLAARGAVGSMVVVVDVPDADGC